MSDDSLRWKVVYYGRMYFRNNLNVPMKFSQKDDHRILPYPNGIIAIKSWGLSSRQICPFFLV